MGELSLRRLLIIGANSVVVWSARKGTAPGSWLAGMLARKPTMLVRVALANKMARIAWALMAKGEAYRAPVVAAYAAEQPRGRRSGRGERKGWRNGRETRSGKPICDTVLYEHAVLIWT